MKRRPPPDRHLDSRTALDYLDGLLSPARRRTVEAHLARPCAACRERLRELGALTHRMLLDRVPPIPEALTAAARDVFAPAVRPGREPGALERIAELLFDSWTAPLPAAVRRAIGEARRLRLALGDGVLDLECETDSPGLLNLRGRLRIEDATLHRLELEIGGETRAVWPDAGGSFVLERVPTGEARFSLVGPSGRFRFPPLTL